MDMMIPYFRRITHFTIEPKRVFHSAGMQSGSAAKKVEQENKKKRELQKSKSLRTKKNKLKKQLIQMVKAYT
ncbi:MAG: hypothetical protein ACTJH9_04870 [Pseudoalteromonas sp.]|uniref:hypothetical protein n=1 Tax=unclassified Pseudoalteromonas TaxID=194690 RepID=UPI003F94D390